MPERTALRLAGGFPVWEALLCVFLVGLIFMGQEALAAGRELVSPPANTIVQRNAAGVADIDFIVTPAKVPGRASLRPVGKSRPVRKAVLPSGKTNGRFSAVPAGWYDLCLEGRRQICRRVGVGEVFLVAGQSNAVSPVTASTPSPAGETGLVAVSAHHGDGPIHEAETPDIETMLVPSAKVPVRAGVCWVRLGDLLAKKYKAPIGFIIVAKSGSFTDCWKPGGGTCWPLMAKALAARRFRAVFWHQGESDIIYGFSEARSLANMEALVAASRQIQPGIPWFVARNSLKTATPYAEQPVRKAQASLIASGQVCAGPDTDVIREHPGWTGEADFGGKGVTRHGELWFPYVDAYLSGQACAHRSQE